jgi:hypothetical protein
MGEKRNAYRILVGKPDGKRPLGRPRRRWVNSIKMDLREIGWDGMDWIDLAQDRDQWKALVNTVMNFRVPVKYGREYQGTHTRERLRWQGPAERVPHKNKTVTVKQ